MQIIRRIILAIALIAGLVPAFAAAPPPVPALPDAERRTTYSLNASKCACTINFALYGDSIDYQSWMEVWLNNVLVNYDDPVYGWTLTSPTGPIANIPRPITDGVLTFTNPQTGTIQIVGARRPRRALQFSESAGVSARSMNQVLTDIVAMLREVWDKINDVSGRVVMGLPGETMAPLPPAAQRAGLGACFDATGNLVTCVSIAPSTIVAGPGVLLTGTNPTVISAQTLLNSVSGAATTFTSGQCGSVIRRTNGGAAMVDALPGTSPGVLPNHCGVTITDNDTAGLLAVAAGTGAILQGGPTVNGYVYLGPGQSLQVESDGSNYWVLSAPAQVRLSANTTFFATATGGSATNNGLTAAAPMNTITAAYNLAQQILNANGFTVTIQAADGAYGVTTLVNRIPGQGETNTQKGLFPVIIQGNTTSPTNATISAAGNAFGALQVNGDASLLVQGFSLSTTGGGNGLYVNRAWVAYKAMDFGSTSINQVAGTHQAHIEIAGNYTWTGAMGCHWLVSDGASIFIENAATITATTRVSAPAMNPAFACAQYPSAIVNDFTPTFAGASVSAGQKCNAALNGIVNGFSIYPGTGNSIATGGVCN